MNQLSFFESIPASPGSAVPVFKGAGRRASASDGKQLRDRGIKRAAQHAEDVSDGWGQKALDFLYIYAREHERFSGEMVRLEAKGIVEDPPSLRAWGSILVKGANRGWIKQIDYIKVINPKAHKANAALWKSLLSR